MTEIREVDMGLIDLPENAQRSETDDEAMIALCDSIETHGLLQPVGVTPLEGGRFRLVWGSRRRMAHELMGKPTILAKIVPSSAQEEDDMIMVENYHREELNPLDEAAFIKRYLERHCVSQAEFARRTKTNPHRVSSLLSLLESDEEVSAALRTGRISRAQALAINTIKDRPGRQQALIFARNGDFSAQSIAQWGKQREQSGVSDSVGSIDWENFDRHQQHVKNLAKCVLHDDWIEYNIANFLVICTPCYNAVKALIIEAQAAKEKT